MPVWHAATREWVKSGRLVLLGVVQEQHADRARLFAQWQQLDWPILHDPINILRLQAVPIPVAIDEHGIVRAVRPDLKTFEADFLNKTFPDDGGEAAPLTPKASDIAALREQAKANPTAGWRALGDALALWGGPGRLDEAIVCYQRAAQVAPADGDAFFRLGVCRRLRYETASRRPGDFQAAVDGWSRALATNPNQYIWRRRIQQYGPRLDKPYAFYDWVAEAAKAIAARGDTPIALAEPPYGSEIAFPLKDLPQPEALEPPDPEGKVRRDDQRLIEAEVAVVPASVAPGQSVRVHITFRPSRDAKAHWNNETEPLRLWVDVPAGWRVSDRLLVAPQPRAAETGEVRRLDFEVQAPPGAAEPARFRLYALYNVYETQGGQCLFLRQDISVEIALRK
ncbi:MAG TPA: hypothetical protein VNE39_09255 [Planctomycetota bacterium]|nr:hypothetical protein [Planctomycetota bacterium]